MVIAHPNTTNILCGGCHKALQLDSPDADRQAGGCPDCGWTYRWNDGILILGDTASQNDYPDESYALLADVEPRHFWFATRNQIIVATMRRSIGQLVGRSVLDIGCGTGFVLMALEQTGMAVCGLDMHLAGLRHARKRTHGLLGAKPRRACLSLINSMLQCCAT